MRLVLFAVTASVLSGCVGRENSGCWCEGDELEFSPVGSLAGIWESEVGHTIAFDEDHRPRKLDTGSSYNFGCSPGQYPLVLGSKTSYQSGLDVITHELTDAQIEPGRFELGWAGEGWLFGLEADVEGETLVIDGPIVATPFLRVDEEPAKTPDAAKSCD